jgi:CelD/BcsL family acetyltransferase involved in cellulose biosynthesis
MPVTQNFAPVPRRKTERNSPFSDEALLLTDAPVPGMAPPEPTKRQEDARLWIESIVGPQQLKAEWQSLADDCAEPNPFYEPWMVLPALEHFGKGVQLLFAFAEVRGKRLLCGFFPVQRRRGRVELWRYPYCYSSAPLLRRGYERKALAVFLDALAEHAGIARLDDVPGDGPIRRHLIDELNQRGWPCVVSACYTRAVLRRAASAEEYLASAVCGKRRKEWRRQRARLGEQGVVVTQELTQGEDPRGFVADLCSLEKAGWKGREGVDAARDQAFLEQMAVIAAREGRQQLLALRLNGKPLALKWNLLSGDTGFAFKIAFDEQFARFSPGVQLELENVERAHLLPRLRFMDSCAAPNRFMINHLWPDRREMQTLFIGTGSRLGALTVAAVPLLNFVRGCVRKQP